jgi:inhibitor of KinA
MTPRLVRASDHSVLVSFGETISDEAHGCVVRFLSGFPAGRALNLHPGYASVLISFDPLTISHEEIEQAALSAVSAGVVLERPRTVELPVCYGGEFGPDLDGVAAETGLDAARVIELHSAADYRVAFLGFSPGFPYLDGMPAELAAPRLASPRPLVPAGSVGIAGRQTGVYPSATPGGWRLIGRTPMQLFDALRTPPALLAAGNRVRFTPITRTDFERLAGG